MIRQPFLLNSVLRKHGHVFLTQKNAVHRQYGLESARGLSSRDDAKERGENLKTLAKIKTDPQFFDTLPGIIHNLVTGPKLSQIPEVASWVKRVLEHNLNGGKHTRGLMTTLAYEMLEKPENITQENRQLARVLGWCLEMVHGFYCVQDDIIDGSTTRRGGPCWHLMPNVGMSAVNDYFLMTCCVTEALEIYFLKTPHFVELVRLFHKGIFYTSMGQQADWMGSHSKNKDYSHFTVEYYETIITYKTAFFSINLPVLLAMTIIKDVDLKMYAGMEHILTKIGNLFQTQDDYIDCYGDEAVTGKAATDIQEGKCTWLAVTALQHCNESQRKLFTNHYGSKKLEDVAVIKKLYNDLKVGELFKEHEVTTYYDVVRLASELPSEALSKYFLVIINNIYKRER